MTVSDKINETPFCPCCGRPNSIRQSPEWLLVHFSGLFGNILSMLLECRRERRTASMRDLSRAAYPDKKQVPVNAHNAVNSLITGNRARLQSLGWDVAGPMTTGTGFYLVPVDSDR